MARNPKKRKTPACRDGKWFAREFNQLADDLDRTLSQAKKDTHLMVHAIRVVIRASRLAVEATNARLIQDYAELGEQVNEFRSGTISGRQGRITVGSDGRLNVELVVDAVSTDGHIPLDEISDDRLFCLWGLPIMPWLVQQCPDAFRPEAGKFDWETYCTDDNGRPVVRNGKPPGHVTTEQVDSATGMTTTPSDFADRLVAITEGYDDEDWLAHNRERVCDWADACRALADLIAESETEVNREDILPDGETDESPSGDGNDPTRGQKPTKQRMKRQIAEPMIAEHLKQRPHDTAKDVASRVGCSAGLVGESKAWALNQRRLKLAQKHGIDPKAVKLDERAVNAIGGEKMRQLHHSRQQVDEIDGEMDAKDQELFRRIGKYQKEHPNATPEQVASEIGCTAGDVERRQAALNRLVAKQGDDQLEDVDVEDPGAQRGKRRKWVPKRV